jgi:predicted transcriptional regulator
MSFDETVLRAMLRLARRQTAAEEAEIALRVGAEASRVRASLRRLDRVGLVELRWGRATRLTLQGLAMALATLPPSTGVSKAPSSGESQAAPGARVAATAERPRRRLSA